VRQEAIRPSPRGDDERLPHVLHDVSGMRRPGTDRYVTRAVAHREEEVATAIIELLELGQPRVVQPATSRRQELVENSRRVPFGHVRHCHSIKPGVGAGAGTGRGLRPAGQRRFCRTTSVPRHDRMCRPAARALVPPPTAP
jgi:hypothetical protein